MFVLAPPGPCLAGISHVTVRPEDGRHVTEYPPGPAKLRYLADVVAQYGVPYSEERFLAGNHNSYAYLGGRVLAEVGGAPDLVLIAHSTADCEPGLSLNGHLTTVCRNEPLVFAISDQGELSPFSALHILHSYAMDGRLRSAVLLILDQSTLPYPGVRRPPGDRTDHAIGLAFGPATGGGMALTGVAQRFDVTPAGMSQALTELVERLPDADGPVTVIATGTVLGHAELPGRVRVAESGPPCIPPWATLATVIDEGVTGRILLVEYDDSLAGLAIAVFDGPARPETPR